MKNYTQKEAVAFRDRICASPNQLMIFGMALLITSLVLLALMSSLVWFNVTAAVSFYFLHRSISSY